MVDAAKDLVEETAALKREIRLLREAIRAERR
jgi:hypothetical protein